MRSTIIAAVAVSQTFATSSPADPCVQLCALDTDRCTRGSYCKENHPSDPAVCQAYYFSSESKETGIVVHHNRGDEARHLVVTCSDAADLVALINNGQYDIVTGAITTEAPETTSDAPTTEEPSTAAPATREPATEAPATEEPSTEAPTTEAPTTEAPTTEEPSTEAPTTEEPSTQATTKEPETTTEDPASVTITIQDATVTVPAAQASAFGGLFNRFRRSGEALAEIANVTESPDTASAEKHDHAGRHSLRQRIVEAVTNVTTEAATNATTEADSSDDSSDESSDEEHEPLARAKSNVRRNAALALAGIAAAGAAAYGAVNFEAISSLLAAATAATASAL